MKSKCSYIKSRYGEVWTWDSPCRKIYESLISQGKIIG